MMKPGLKAGEATAESFVLGGTATTRVAAKANVSAKLTAAVNLTFTPDALRTVPSSYESSRYPHGEDTASREKTGASLAAFIERGRRRGKPQ
jgi:hypothetical protein